MTKPRNLWALARKGDARRYRRHKAIRATAYGSPERERAERLHAEADAMTDRLWALYGPDPLAAMVAAAPEPTDDPADEWDE